MLEDSVGESLPLRWRSFPLEQVNREDAAWRFWDQEVGEVKGMRAFLAAEAAKDQGAEIFRAFHLEMLKAVHERKEPVHEQETIVNVARSIPGLDVDRMLRDMERPELRERVAADYTEAVDEHGAFGTPTLLFPEGEAVFLKMSPPPAEDAQRLYDSLVQMSARQPYVRELKKPRRPE